MAAMTGQNRANFGCQAMLGARWAAQRVWRGAVWAVSYVGKLALPPRCPSCGVIVDGDRQLCLDCWKTLEFLDGPACARCSMPFAQPYAATMAGMDCGACLADPPDFEGALAAVAYGGVARKLALRLKHGRRIGDAQLMAQYMARKLWLLAGRGGDALPPELLLIPVPLHRWRMWRRGYNQSAMIAQHMAKISGAAWDGHVLARHKSTPTMQGKTKRERRQIVTGAFSVDAKARHTLRGRHVVLIDDVHASGATLRACAKICKRHGATKISAITWARVVPSAIMTSNIFDFAAWDSDMGVEEQ
jgi:ComF family protein